MGSLFGGGGNSQPQPTRSPKGVRIISQYGEVTPAAGTKAIRPMTIGQAMVGQENNQWPPVSSLNGAGGSY